MHIKIGNFEFTEVWDGVLYKKLSNYPHMTDWEKRNLIEFIQYEEMNLRPCSIECEDKNILDQVEEAIKNKEFYLQIEKPYLITECTACPVRKGCVTEFICHTTTSENAKKIFSSGKLLSAVRARGISAEQLRMEDRNAAKDPVDYFDYVMLAWGNCQAGDRLVMERKLGHFPDEEDLSIRFLPGVRFYFKYDVLMNHPGATFDGVLPMKIKDEIILVDYIHTIVIPQSLRAELDPVIPENLRSKVIYVDNDCKDIWEWSEKVYRIIEKTNR